MIPIFRPSMGDEEIEAVAEVLKSGWIVLKPKSSKNDLQNTSEQNIKVKVLYMKTDSITY